MSKYNKPFIQDEFIEIEDVIAISYEPDVNMEDGDGSSSEESGNN